MGSALYAVVLLKAIASGISKVHRNEKKKYLATAAEFEQAAVGLLQHVTASGGVGYYEELLLVRTMPRLFKCTVLELARKGHTLKFISSTQVQVVHCGNFKFCLHLHSPFLSQLLPFTSRFWKTYGGATSMTVRFEIR